MENKYLDHWINKEDAIQSGRKRQIELPKKQVKLHSNPKSTIYGNYKNYYNVRKSLAIDSRLLLLDPAYFAAKRVLDFGCNEGKVSIDIARYMKPLLVEGIDLDPELIKRARFQWKMANSMVSNGQVDYYPKSCAELGVLLDKAGIVDFRCGDWIHEDEDGEKFDTILAFSVTKWIHLNGGDGAIRHFFNKCFATLESGGFLILEPQNWEGYQKRAGMTPDMRTNYMAIEMKPDHFISFLTERVGFKLIDAIGESDMKGFDRLMYILRKPSL